MACAASGDLDNAAADSQRPTLASAVFDSRTDNLTMTFSEAIDHTAVHMDRFNITTSGQSPHITLSGAEYTIRGNILDVALTQRQHDLITIVGTVLDVVEGAVRDLARNLIADSSNNPIMRIDTTPHLASAEYYRGDGALAAVFNRKMDVNSVDATKFQITGPTADGFADIRLTQSQLSSDNPGGVKIWFTLNQTNRDVMSKIIGMPVLTVDPGAVRDTAGTDVAPSGVVPVSIYDSTRPIPSPSGSGASGSSELYPPPDPLVTESATYYSTVGLFVITFNETIDADRTMHNRLSVLGEVRNHTFVTVMDGSMYRTGADPLTLVYRLGQGGVDAIHIMESPRLRAESANGVMSVPIPVDVGDTYPPALEWAAYSAETGTLALAFNETLDGAAGGAPLYAYGEGQAGGVALGYNATVRGGMARLVLDQDSRAALNGMAHPHVLVETGIVRDLAGNAVPQTRAPITVQSTVPLPVSASYDPDLGIIILSLDGATDILAVDTTRVYIREYGRDGGITMQHVGRGPDNTIIFRLDGGQWGTVEKMVSPHLYMDVGAMHDAHTNVSPAVSGLPVVSGAGAPVRAAYNVDLGVLAVAFGERGAGANVTLIVEDAGGSGGIPFHMADVERVSGGVVSYRLDEPYRNVLAGAEDARLHIRDGAVAGKAWSRTPDTVVPVEVRPGLSIRPDTGLGGERRTQVAYFTGTVPDGPVLDYLMLAVSCDGAASVLRMDLVLPANDTQDLYTIFAGSVRAGAVPLDHPRYTSDAMGLVVDLAPGLGGDGGLELQPHVSVTIPIMVLDGHDGGDSLAVLHVEYEAPLDVICTIGPALTGSHRMAFVDDTTGIDEVESATLLAVQDFNGYVARLGQPWRLALDTYEAYDGYAALMAVRSLDSPTAVLGPSGNATLWAVLYQTSGDRMLLISCCSDSPEMAMPDHVFRMEPSDAGQAAALGALAADGADHIIVVYRHDENGISLREAATGQMLHGDTRISWIAHRSDTESAAAILEAVRHGEITAAVLLYPEAAGTIRAAAAPHVIWYGMDAILDEPDMPEGTTAVRPGYHIEGTLSDRLDIPPEGEPAARAHRAYEAVFALGTAMLAAQSNDTAALVQSLPRISEAAPDILGIIAFDHNGDLAVPGYTVWMVTNGSWTASGQTVPGTAE